ncbi:MAG: hypothetical protein OD918_05470 [Gammaproteobacteria bacterium]
MKPASQTTAQTTTAQTTRRFALFGALLFAALAAQPAVAQTVSFAQAAYTQNENSAAEIPVTLSAAAAADVVVTYTLGGTAQSETNNFDYAAPLTAPYTVTIAMGADTANIEFRVYGDGYTEPDETVILTLSPPQGYTAGSIIATTFTIVDTTEVIRVQFNPDSRTINETDDVVIGGDPFDPTAISEVPADIVMEALADHPDFAFQITIEADPSSQNDFPDGEDFTTFGGCRSFDLTFPAGVNVISYPSPRVEGINPAKDDLVEHDERCTMRFRTYAPPAATPYAVMTTPPDQAGGTWTLVLVDDDRDSATIAFGADAAATATYAATAAETDGTLNVPVIISHAPGAATTFFIEDITAAEGAASEGAGFDYTIAEKMVVFPAEADEAARTQNIVITLNDDTLPEASEDIVLRLVAADATVDDLGDYYTRNAAAVARISISSEDVGPPPQFALHPGAQTLTLVWTPEPASGSPVTSYLARHRLADAGGGSPGAWMPSADGADAGRSGVYTIMGLTTGNAYEVQMASATADANNSDWSDSQGKTAFTLDADDNGEMDGKDGMLIARYLLGVTGDALTDGVSGASPAAASIIATLGIARGAGALNVDGNSATDWKDGILFARYLFGLRGAPLTAGLTTTDSDTVAASIAASLPPQ